MPDRVWRPTKEKMQLYSHLRSYEFLWNEFVESESCRIKDKKEKDWFSYIFAWYGNWYKLSCGRALIAFASWLSKSDEERDWWWESQEDEIEKNEVAWQWGRK